MKKVLILFLVLFFFGFMIWFFQPFFELEKINILPVKIIETIEKEISTPPLLKILEKTDNPEIVLTKQGIIEWTNIQREENNLPRLKENAILNAMAKAKANDMFESQYFAHESLLGNEVEDMARDFDYEFIFIGENLAMGNFLSDKDLVQAWMDSPGHRENILNKKYQEIGVAVEKGIFNGKPVWIGVQHFGLALTACPRPSEIIKLEIEQKEQEIKKIEEKLSILLAEINKIRPKRGNDYEQKVEEYNNLVQEYNNLLLENKKLIEEYNEQVKEFNQCLVELK